MPDARVRHTELYGPPRQTRLYSLTARTLRLSPIAAGGLGDVTAFRQFCVSVLVPLSAAAGIASPAACLPVWPASANARLIRMAQMVRSSVTGSECWSATVTKVSLA